MTLASEVSELDFVQFRKNKNKIMKCYNFGALNILEDFILIIPKAHV